MILADDSPKGAPRVVSPMALVILPVPRRMQFAAGRQGPARIFPDQIKRSPGPGYHVRQGWFGRTDTYQGASVTFPIEKRTGVHDLPGIFDQGATESEGRNPAAQPPLYLHPELSTCHFDPFVSTVLSTEARLNRPS